MKNMRKKITLSIVVVAMLVFTNCSEVEEAKDTLDGLSCLNKLARLSDNDDDYTCEELIRELNKLKGSCSSISEDIQDYIDAFESSCED
ncbi:hypothetical protein PK35_07285 [Tamlana nanhaiensis]|uniref:Lipoprotein n=1 Tax=Neotamlana nanhaiensis TaxID=1382798 RepID=A0A0D7W4J6_9FLAO|nr:hypothetical protein [Tamlana nanhaiensis]KJD33628.1 hypothetical protein PK35_07285 [Tamlana nanhaiensis]